jgi:hypothetical protein
MKKKSMIHSTTILCSLVIFLVLAIFAWASRETFGSNSTSRSPTMQEQEQFYNEMLQLKESTLKQRSELIAKLLDIIKADKYKYAGTTTAIDILGQIRATEAVDILLDRANYGYGGLTRIPIFTTDPQEVQQDYHSVRALINIRPTHESVMKRLKDENNKVPYNCYIAILIGTEGQDVTRYLIEKAIEKETNTRTLARLNTALAMLNKDFPKDSNDVKQK